MSRRDDVEEDGEEVAARLKARQKRILTAVGIVAVAVGAVVATALLATGRGGGRSLPPHVKASVSNSDRGGVDVELRITNPDRTQRMIWQSGVLGTEKVGAVDDLGNPFRCRRVTRRELIDPGETKTVTLAFDPATPKSKTITASFPREFLGDGDGLYRFTLPVPQ
jgi:hypothetical protein